VRLFSKNTAEHAIVIILIIAAIITPPDVVSQTIVAIPLLVLYEVSIVVVARVQKRQALKEAADEMADRQVRPYSDDMP
jgi:sec-independent protein translocase protein TatC